MKSETQIAKVYLEDLKKYEKPDGRWHLINRTCYEHKRACQRFLEFLEDETNYLFTISTKENCELKEDKVGKKIFDLKNAIEIYEEAGIK